MLPSILAEPAPERIADENLREPTAFVVQGLASYFFAGISGEVCEDRGRAGTWVVFDDSPDSESGTMELEDILSKLARSAAVL